MMGATVLLLDIAGDGFNTFFCWIGTVSRIKSLLMVVLYVGVSCYIMLYPFKIRIKSL